MKKYNYSDENIERELNKIFNAGMKNHKLHPDDDSYDVVNKQDATKKVFCMIQNLKYLPDIYEGKTNTARIKAYRKLKELWNVDEGTIRDLFCAGAEWYRDFLAVRAVTPKRKN